jgi:long-chain acyl-CoA synthetase
MTALLPTIINGAALIMMRSFHPRQVLDAIDQYGGTHILGVPSHYQQLLRYGEAHEALRKLKFAFCAAAPLKVSVAQAWWDATHLNLAEGYGCIETSTALSIRNSKLPDPMGEVGFHKSEFVNIRIMDDTGEPKDTPGVRGEVVIKAPSVMMGYFNRPDATEIAIRRGWYHSGDLGYFKNDGSLVLAGRIKDVINIAGIKISPLEVESVLNRHPEVIESAVFGREHDLYGEVVVACVKKSADSKLGERHLIMHAGNYLQQFQVPRDIYFIDRFPRNTMGKIDKVELRKWVMARSGL